MADLITIEELKAHIFNNSLDKSASEDTQFATWISAASKTFLDETGRDMILGAHTEYYDGDGGQELWLDNYPVNSITSIHIDPDHAYATAVTATDILLYAASGRVVVKNTSFTEGPRSVKVIYNAGYAIASIPADIKLAFYEQIKAWWLKWKKNAEHLDGEVIPEVNIKFTSTDLIPSFVRILKQYRRRGHFGVVGA